VDGKKLASYQVSISGSTVRFALEGTTNVYFSGRLIAKGTFNSGGSNDKITLASVKSDRLGSIGKFYPYGQERPSATPNDTEKFTGYYRDAATGLDYADQRYEQPGVGRFMSPDPASSSAKSNDPGSWNRYAYVGGDPINGTDPTGLYRGLDGEKDDSYDDFGYGLIRIPSFGFGGGAHSILFDRLNIAWATCEDATPVRPLPSNPP
jgi:RHS repeat-associated protein